VPGRRDAVDGAGQLSPVWKAARFQVVRGLGGLVERLNRRFPRFGGFAAAGAAAGTVLAAIALGGPSAASGQYQYDKKVTICHHTGSEKNPFVTITVSRNALPAHLEHGDTVGPCP
jgi:hypothetical protein